VHPGSQSIENGDDALECGWILSQVEKNHGILSSSHGVHARSKMNMLCHFRRTAVLGAGARCCWGSFATLSSMQLLQHGHRLIHDEKPFTLLGISYFNTTTARDCSHPGGWRAWLGTVVQGSFHHAFNFYCAECCGEDQKLRQTRTPQFRTNGLLLWTFRLLSLPNPRRVQPQNIPTTMFRGGDLTSHMDGYNNNVAAVTSTGHSVTKFDDAVHHPPDEHDRSTTTTTMIRHDQAASLYQLYHASRPEHVMLFLSMIVLGLTSAVQLTTPYVTSQIIDGALQFHQQTQTTQQQEGQQHPEPAELSTTTTTTLLLVQLFGIMSVASYLTYVRSVWQCQCANNLTSRLRRALLAAILYQDANFFELHSAGDLLSRLSNDAETIQNAISTNLVTGVRNALMAIGAAIACATISWRLAILALLVLPPSMIVAKWRGREMQRRNGEIATAFGRAAARASSALHGIRTVQLSNAESYELSRYGQVVQSAHTFAVSAGKRQFQSVAIIQLLSNGSMMLVLGYGGHLVQYGKLSAGQLAAFVMYSLILAGNITGLSSAYLDLSKTLAAMDRLMQIIDCAPSTTTTKTTTMPNNNSIPPPMIAKQQHLPRRRQKKHRNGWSILPMFDRQPHPPMHRPWFNDDDEDHDDDYRRSHHGGENDVTTTRGGPISASFRDVSFAYPSRPNVTVLHDFSLDIAAGQTVAIVGASGAGKSTVAALLTRLYDKNTPTTNGNGGGHIYLDGVDISTLSPHDVRERVGVVSQEPTLFPNMTIADNIRYGTFHSVTDRDVYEAAVAAHVWDFCPHPIERWTKTTGGHCPLFAQKELFTRHSRRSHERTRCRIGTRGSTSARGRLYGSNGPRHCPSSVQYSTGRPDCHARSRSVGRDGHVPRSGQQAERPLSPSRGTAIARRQTGNKIIMPLTHKAGSISGRLAAETKVSSKLSSLSLRTVLKAAQGHSVYAPIGIGDILKHIPYMRRTRLVHQCFGIRLEDQGGIGWLFIH
jgi:ABC-type multidrug transport system fused ATPase/permease subunit